MLGPRSIAHAHVRARAAHLATAAALVAFVLGGAASARAAQPTDPPGPWAQFQGDAAHDGLAVTGPAPPYARAWTHAVAPTDAKGHSFGVSAPVIDGTTVYAASGSAVVALDLTTGAERWSVDRQGPPSTPAVADAGGRRLVLFTDTTDEGAGEVRAVDAGTGKDAWAAPSELPAVSRTGVTVDAGTAYVGDADGDVVAVDVATGKQTWSASIGGEAKGPVAVGDGNVYAVPLSHDFSTSVAASIVALDASDGSISWRVTSQPASPFASLPAAADGTVVVVAPQAVGDAHVVGLGAADGTERWSARINLYSFYFAAPAVAPDAVYTADFNGGLHAVSPASSEQTWQFQFNERVLRGSPVVVGDHVLLGLGDGTFGAVDRATGHLAWRSPHLPGVVDALAVGPDVLVASVGGAHGGLFAFRHDDAGRLVDVVSPTEPRWLSIVGNFAAAAVGVGLVVSVPLILLARRTGPPLVDDDREPQDGYDDEGHEGDEGAEDDGDEEDEP